uniref:Oxysterol binding protein-like 1A n=1 Tax=Mus musculus TaxID=10090 RepID=D6RDE4_MOUSE
MNTEAEQQLLHHARNGNAEEVRKLLAAMARMEVVADIDCKEVSLTWAGHLFTWHAILDTNKWSRIC